MRNLFYLFGIIFLSACNSLSSPTAPPSEKMIEQPSATSTAVPSPTATEFFPTLRPVPTADSNFFHEDFDGNLAALWTWVREDPQNWSLIDLPGSLVINVRPGYVVAHSNSNLLLRPAPTGNFLIETRVTF